MYIGNLSDFFYKNKSWLLNQPKFSVESNKKNNTIMKIGKKYYNLNSVTGKLELIKTNNISPKNISMLFGANNSISKENKKEKKEYFPEIFNNIEKKRNIKSQNNKSKNSNKNLIISLFQGNNKNNKSIDNINNTYNFFSFEKNESNLLNNSNTSRKEQTSTDNNEIMNKLINIKNANNNKYNKSINSNHTRQSSLKLNTESKIKNEVITKIKRESIKYRIKFNKNKKSRDNKKIESQFLSKRNIKKIIEKRQRDNDELKTNNTNTNTSNNNTNTNPNKSSTYNIKSTPKYYNRTINLKKQITPLNMNQKEFINKFFPNSDSLSIKKDDSWFLKTIKNQLFKDRIYTNLKKQFEFYQDSENKRDLFIIPKINIKNTIMLSKKDIFPNKESVYHKLFFDYINKQKQRDNKDKCFFNY